MGSKATKIFAKHFLNFRSVVTEPFVGNENLNGNPDVFMCRCVVEFA